MDIYKNFKNIAGFNLEPRQTNFLWKRTTRIDRNFFRLSRLYYSNPGKLVLLKNRVIANLKCEKSETLHSVAGYLYYLCGDFKKSRDCFLNAISTNPDNLDNWFDLAFALRHCGEFKTFYGLIYSSRNVIYYYKYFKLYNCKYQKLKKLILLINKLEHSRGYSNYKYSGKFFK